MKGAIALVFTLCPPKNCRKITFSRENSHNTFIWVQKLIKLLQKKWQLVVLNLLYDIDTFVHVVQVQRKRW